ncbi:MAG TPA: ThuA domain-containing protein, partial [Verrucomicrobiae bacterium]|nr:ThuA domain-containing protein [Verrucomicrobiae bacterium]
KTPAGSGAIKVFMMGGGSAHDCEKWFHQADKAILLEGGLADPVYSGKAEETARLLPHADVLYQSANHELPASARQAILDHVAAGKGVVLLHAGIWYNWRDWPEYNRELCGGGSRGHDRLGPFTVHVTEAGHPVMKGVPASFEIVDEHYWFEPDPKGTPIKVLATARSKQKDKDYPMVFVVEHPKARIVAIALGHDDKAHNLPAYQTLLRNAVAWAAGK